MAKHTGLMVTRTTNSQILKGLLSVILIGIVFSAAPTQETRADEPGYDPWYYVDSKTYKFSMPDKLQHFYGSAVLTKVVGPMPALAMGVSKEVYDDQYAKVGFSVKDLVADVLGIMSAKFAHTDNVSMWLDWSPGQETLVLQVSVRL